MLGLLVFINPALNRQLIQNRCKCAISAGKNGENVFISVKSSVANWQARLLIHKWARQGDAVITGKGLNKFVQHFAFL